MASHSDSKVKRKLPTPVRISSSVLKLARQMPSKISIVQPYEVLNKHVESLTSKLLVRPSITQLYLSDSDDDEKEKIKTRKTKRSVNKQQQTKQRNSSNGNFHQLNPKQNDWSSLGWSSMESSVALSTTGCVCASRVTKRRRDIELETRQQELLRRQAEFITKFKQNLKQEREANHFMLAVIVSSSLAAAIGCIVAYSKFVTTCPK